MKNLKFKIVAILLAATSALLYTGCQKNKGGLGPVDAASLQGGTWVYSSSVLDYFDESGKKVYTEDLVYASNLTFLDNRTVNVAYRGDKGGFGIVIQYDNFRYYHHSFPTENRNDRLSFENIETNESQHINLGVGAKSRITFIAQTLEMGSLNGTDMSLLSNQQDNHGQGWEFTPLGSTTKIKAAKAYLTIYYKKGRKNTDPV